MKLTIFAFIASISSTAAFAPSRTASTNTQLSVTVEAPPAQQTKAPVFDEVCDTTGVTLTRFMSEVAMLNPEIAELTTLFGAIDTSCKAITNLVKRSQLPSSETLGLEGEVNVQGEDQKKLDVITNDLLKRALRFTGKLGVLASEEEDEPVSIEIHDASFILHFLALGNNNVAKKKFQTISHIIIMIHISNILNAMPKHIERLTS